jgi:hypothetical protein
MASLLRPLHNRRASIVNALTSTSNESFHAGWYRTTRWQLARFDRFSTVPTNVCNGLTFCHPTRSRGCLLLAAQGLSWAGGTRPTLNLQRQTSPFHSITDPQQRYTKEAAARWRKP